MLRIYKDNFGQQQQQQQHQEHETPEGRSPQTRSQTRINHLILSAGLGRTYIRLLSSDKSDVSKDLGPPKAKDWAPKAKAKGLGARAQGPTTPSLTSIKRDAN